AAFSGVVPASAQRRSQNSQDNPLASATAFECTFTSYAVPGSWEGGSVGILSGTDSFTYRIADINQRRNTARLVVTDATSVPVTAVVPPAGLNVIEQTQIGNFFLTTIFRAGARADTYIAVHSRHLGDLSTMPSVSQYYGTCKAAPGT